MGIDLELETTRISHMLENAMQRVQMAIEMLAEFEGEVSKTLGVYKETSAPTYNQVNYNK